jgi:hypothetical protein
MKIKELIESIGTIGSTTNPIQGNSIPQTGNNPGPNQPGGKPNQPAQPQTLDPAQLSQVKSNLNSLKDPIKAANGGNDFDSSILAKTLTDPTATSNNNISPMSAKALKAMIPVLGAAEKNTATANSLRNTFTTAAQGQLKQQQASSNQKNAQTPVKV